MEQSMTPYDTIATFGLVGDNYLDHLTFPDDDVIRTDAVGAAFDALTTPLRSSILEALSFKRVPALWNASAISSKRICAL